MIVRVAVITPYYKEPMEMLRQCHESVARQTYPCLHVMVADGFPHLETASWSIDHVTLPKAHRDIGSTPRLIGCYHAIGLGYDAVAFLDADNWYREDHIASLVRLVEQGAGFASSSRYLCRLDGSPMAPCPLIDPERFIDTSCMLFARPAFQVLANWVLMPDYGHLIGDRIMLYHIKRSGVRRAHNPLPTVFYRCDKEGLYRQLGEAVPFGVHPRPDYEISFLRWVADGNPPLV
jgi:glycosyltransferase involved in cell wall biosynthesis